MYNWDGDQVALLLKFRPPSQNPLEVIVYPGEITEMLRVVKIWTPYC